MKFKKKIIYQPKISLVALKSTLNVLFLFFFFFEMIESFNFSKPYRKTLCYRAEPSFGLLIYYLLCSTYTVRYILYRRVRIQEHIARSNSYYFFFLPNVMHINNRRHSCALEHGRQL